MSDPAEEEVCGESPLPERRTVRVRIPDGWAKGLIAGVEAGLIGWGLSVLPALAAHLSVVSNPWTASLTWEQAFRAGTDVWASALGGSLLVNGTTYRAVPSLITVATFLVLRAILFQGRRFPVASHLFAIPGFVAVCAVALVSAAGHSVWWTALAGMILLPCLAVGWAILSYGDKTKTYRLLPAWVRSGAVTGLSLIGGLALIGSAAGGIALWTGWERIRGIHDLLMTSTVLETVASIVTQVSLAPTVILWALAWLSGAGFYIGADAFHGPDAAPVAPIPVIPLLGAVPSSVPGYVVLLAPIGAGIGIAVLQHLWRPVEDIVHLIKEMLTAALVVGGAVWVWASSATMILGAGRLARVGPDPTVTAVLLVVEAVGACALIRFALHPTSRAFVASLRDSSVRRFTHQKDGSQEAEEEKRARMVPSHKEKRKE